MARPWGSFESLRRGPGFQVKQLTVTPGRRLSLQTHARRAEHWVVVAGVADATLEGATLRLGIGETLYIPCGAVHRLANPSEGPLVVIEVQTGNYLGEDDIVRLADDHARA